MAIPHCRITAQSRSMGQSAVAKAAYNSCSRLRDSGEIFDYRKKKGLVHAEMVFADGEKPQSRGVFWRTVEKAETRCDACISREIVFALPIELNRDQRIALAQEISQTILKHYEFKGVDLSIHEPPIDKRKRDAETAKENPHAHLQIPTRDKNGKKLRQFNGPHGCNTQEIKKIRKIFENVTNHHLRAAGIKNEISTDRLEVQLEKVEAELAKTRKKIKDLSHPEPSPLYIAHYEDLKKICKPEASEEEINFRLACRLRATGHSQEETAAIIDSFQHDAIYGQQAAKAAFTSPKADKDIKKLSKWISKWKQLEQAAIEPDWKIKQELEKCHQKQPQNSMQSAKNTNIHQ